ncbi:MAG: DUF2293 domain-containing protein [Pirellulaceae bacterium]
MAKTKSGETIVAPGPTPKQVRDQNGNCLTPPANWSLLPPGDATLTRRVKAAGEYWLVQTRKGRRVFSQGIWAPEQTIRDVQKQLKAERSTETYAKQRKQAAERRDKHQVEYVADFEGAIVQFLDFHPTYAGHARRFARLVASHATPIGSGTVARTKRIPIERRAEAAVIAWMRHQTTDYDTRPIARVKGKRRETRRILASASRQLLERYRQGKPVAANCPLYQALTANNPQ